MEQRFFRYAEFLDIQVATIIVLKILFQNKLLLFERDHSSFYVEYVIFQTRFVSSNDISTSQLNGIH